MSQDDRTEWLKVAWSTLSDVPADLLAMACRTARKTCDHPAKIVPAIIREVETSWARRRVNRAEVLAAIAKMKPPPDDEPLCTPEEAAAIIKRVGLNMSA